MRLPPFERENYEVSESHIIFLIPVKLTIIVNTMSHQHSVYSHTAFSLVFLTSYGNISILQRYPWVAKPGDAKLGTLTTNV